MKSALAVFSLLTACAVSSDPASNEAAPSLDARPTPPLDMRATGGLTEADHVEVAPGIYAVRSSFESGEVGVVPATPQQVDAALRASTTGGSPPPPAFPGGGGGSSCLDSASDNYTDSTRTGETFGDNPSWYGSVVALTYHETRPGRESRSDYATTYAYTSSPHATDYIYAYGYVYIDGRYVGYISGYETEASYATALANWDLRCAGGGDVTVEMRTYHYIYDEGGIASLSIGSTVETTLSCCP